MNIEFISIVCGVLAGAIQLYGYWVYNKGIFTDPNKKPNAASWGMWGFGSFLTLMSFHSVAKDWVKEALPFVCVIACFATCVVCVLKKRIARPDIWDVFIVVLDLLVVAFWIISKRYTDKSNEYTNLLFQLDTAISFIPMIRGVWKDPSSEDSKPWAVWTVAYSVMFFTVILRFERWWDVAYPVTYIILHAAVWLIVKFRTAKVP